MLIIYQQIVCQLSFMFSNWVIYSLYSMIIWFSGSKWAPKWWYDGLATVRGSIILHQGHIRSCSRHRRRSYAPGIEFDLQSLLLWLNHYTSLDSLILLAGQIMSLLPKLPHHSLLLQTGYTHYLSHDRIPYLFTWATLRLSQKIAL